MADLPEYADIKIVALMSVPRVGWNDSWGCINEALRPFKIPIRLSFGAYWHQLMSNMLEDCVDEGIDWILTLDYDSIFSAEQLDKLIGLFGARSDIDALSVLQCKRGIDEVPLLTTSGKSEVEIAGEPLKVDTAHFGMTLFRTEALRRMPKPWFVSVPDERGSYRSIGRVDADIFFWHKWREVGNTAYVDPYNAIGHLQPMVAVYDEQLKPKHVHVTEWRKANAK